MSESYEGREQSLVKHFVLRKYLERFARIIGLEPAKRWNTITYVDCFSGPWNVKNEDLSDSSFSIALNELRRARETCKEHGRIIRLRCLFLEKKESAFNKLSAFADGVKDAEIKTINASLSESVSDIITFAKSGGPKSFSFFFLDPTGWSALELDVIAPLLQLSSCEVLVNFMTSFVRRFIASPDPATQQSFERIYGPYLPKIEELPVQDREDAAVAAYAEALREVGNFEYACKAIVLHPQINKTHFHLVYASRHKKGIEVFKDAERAAMRVQQTTRAQARGKQQEKRTGQPTLFPHEVMQDMSYYDALRDKYSANAKAKVAAMINSSGQVRFDDAWVATMTEPLVQEQDLKAWIHEWVQTGCIRLRGLKPRQRVPQWGEGIVLERQRTVS
jgi:three-Cys-motif partner protein